MPSEKLAFAAMILKTVEIPLLCVLNPPVVSNIFGFGRTVFPLT